MGYCQLGLLEARAGNDFFTGVFFEPTFYLRWPNTQDFTYDVCRSPYLKAATQIRCYLGLCWSSKMLCSSGSHTTNLRKICYMIPSCTGLSDLMTCTGHSRGYYNDVISVFPTPVSDRRNVGFCHGYWYLLSLHSVNGILENHIQGFHIDMISVW